jgi:hypothetical protein
VTAAAHGERQSILACEAYSRRNVGRIYRMYNQRRMLIHLGHVTFAKLLISWIAGPVHLS